MSKCVVTNVGKRFVNNQSKGPSVSLIGFVPFYSDIEFNEYSTKADIIADAMFGVNSYYFNGKKYCYENNEIKPVDIDEEYKNLFDVVSEDGLYKVKYTNTIINGEPVSIYHLNLNIDDISVDLRDDLSYDASVGLKVKSIALFIQSQVIGEVAKPSNVELFAILDLGTYIDLVKNDITWTLAFDSDGNVVELVDEEFSDFEELAPTTISDLYSAKSLEITDNSYTFSDNYHNIAKTNYYDDWVIGFVKGGYNELGYDLVLEDENEQNNIVFFNINPTNNTLEIQNSNRDLNVIFGGITIDNYKANDSFIVNSNGLKADKDSSSIFTINSEGSYTKSKHISVVSNGGKNDIQESNNVTVFGGYNKIYNSNNVSIYGNDNVSEGDNNYIVGNGNKSERGDSIIFGNNLSTNVNSSINLGSDYDNNNYSFVYSNENKVFSLDNSYGNFVVEDKDGGSNVQFSKDSVYLMNEHSTIDSTKSKNSFIVDNKTVSSENSYVYGEYEDFSDSFIKNSISVGSSVNSNDAGTRKNSIVENSLDVSEKLENVSSKNSILDGEVTFSDGLLVENSYINDLMGNNGDIFNSIVLSGNIRGDSEVNNSLILNIESDYGYSGKIENSIIQGDVSKSTFINSHLIGNLPAGVNKEFKNCLVVGNGTEYTEIYSDKIIKDGEEIPLENIFINASVDEQSLRGKEWKFDIDETYKQKIENILDGQSIYYRSVDVDEFIFAGKLKEGQSKAVFSIYVMPNDGGDFVLDCYYSGNTVMCDVTECNPLWTNTTQVGYMEDIINKFKFCYRNGIICVKNKFKKCLAIYRFNTCEILDNVMVDDFIENVDSFLVDKPINTHEFKVSNQDALQYYSQEGEYKVSAENFNIRKIKESESETIEFTNSGYKELWDSTQNDFNNVAQTYSSYGYMMSNDYPIKLTVSDGVETAYNETFDGIFKDRYEYINGRVYVSENNTPLVSAINNGLCKVTDGITVDEDTKINNQNISDLLIEGYDERNYLTDNNKFDIDAMTKYKTNCEYYSFTDTKKQYSTNGNFAIRPLYSINQYISESDIFNVTKLVLWGKIANLSIYTSNMQFLDSTKKISIFETNFVPYSDIKSYVIFPNTNELYPFNNSKYVVETNGECHLSILRRSGSYKLYETDNVTVEKPYVNPFQKIYETGLIKHELSYIYKVKSSGVSNYKDFLNTHFQEDGERIKSKIEDLNIIRLEEYFYS